MNKLFQIKRIYSAIHINQPQLYISCNEYSIDKRFRPKVDAGIQKRKKILNENPELLSDLEDQENFENTEFDCQSVNYSVAELKKEQRQQRSRMNYEMVKRKFFAPAKQPNMLTWAERLQIRKLHEEDPETWTFEVLTDSFPATKEIISKIIHHKWQPENLKAMKAKDRTVFRNWKLLEEGKLEIDEKLEKHVRKFLPRREEYLASLENEDFSKLIALPEPKQVWNNGQMSKILESYERSLASLDKRKTKLLASKQVDKANVEAPEIETYINEGDNEDSKEPYLIGERVSTNLESHSSSRRPNDYTKEDEGLATTKLQQIPEKTIRETIELTKKIGTQFTQKTERSEDIRENLNTKGVEHYDCKLIENYSSEKDKEVFREGYTKKDKGLVRTKLEQISDKTIRETTEAPEKIGKPYSITQKTERSQDIRENLNARGVEHYDCKLIENYSSEKDKEVFREEERSIRGSSFWPDNDGLVFGKDSFKSANQRKREVNRFPEKIKIPKNKRGKGLTFQVKDCFYDDDGEFLYRVPGMTMAEKKDNDQL